ncbi:MAG: peptide-N-glycosidase F-related protein [Saprospiraceae bacterium]|nr:peptide-N-glycosidase F-related protein [Saprospiraceae bacterium]
MKNLFCCLLLIVSGVFSLNAQDIIEVQTLTYDSTGRDYMFEFPEEDGSTYERILMKYNMRCKGAKISVPGNTNLGCGEWDYSCNTYIVDSSYVDSLSSTHPSYIISGFDGEEFSYTNTPTNTYVQYDQKKVEYTSTTSETLAAVVNGDQSVSHPFDPQYISSKTQYVWSASELSNAGLTAGSISGLQMDLDWSSANIDFLRVRMGNTMASEPNSSTVLRDDLEQVYFLNTTLLEGNNYLKFYEDFEWDGSSNILVEFSFTNKTNSSEAFNVKGGEVSDGIGLTSTGVASYLNLTGSENVILPNDRFDQISDEITISLWSYGDEEVLPRNTTIFEGTDNQNNRQANVHLPWSNGQVYWDCGFSGGYDRINKQANPEDFSGKWNHWAFTKNATTGSMKIYLNGELWHSGTGLTKSIDIKKMNLGSDRNGNNKYFGKIDEFRVWDKELDASTIAKWMSRKIDASHPNFSNLVKYVPFNEGGGDIAYDQAGAGGICQITGIPKWDTQRGNDRKLDFIAVSERPNITFVNGIFGVDITTLSVIDTTENLPKTITKYQVIGTDLEVEEESQAWEASPELLYAEDGTVLDEFAVDSEGVITIESLDYFRKFPSRFEIMSFVTPYGIFLDLGEDGKTWTFDVTDFAPILKGKKRMYLTLGGQNQEEMDIKFEFIKGTPPREVMDIRQIWRSGRSTNNNAIRTDAVFAPVDYKLDENGSYFKIRTAITGHGQEGEFVPRYHEVKLNGETTFQWQVWTECADNPVFPQGGTWIYDRAGWCPGAPTDLNHWDITDMVTPGDMVNFDYDMFQAAGDSRYIVNHQLVTYGAANFQNDARLVDVIRPSNKVEYAKINPVCSAPIVVIENTGAETLTSATISYYVHGGEKLTFEWEGSLGFLEQEEVSLPLPGMSFWLGSGQTNFIAEVSNPNGVMDEYSNNDKYISPFDMPDMIDEEALVVYTFTNNYGSENSLRFKDFDQNIIFSREEMEPNFFYIDTIPLAEGCYTMEVDDTGDNGMEFWAQPNQGSGSVTFLSLDEQVVKTFDSDFGKFMHYSFVKGQFTNVETVERAIDFKIFPNPNNGIFNLTLELNQPEDIEVIITDITGKKVYSKTEPRYYRGTLDIDLSHVSGGLYSCTVVSGSKVSSKKMVINR